MPFKTLGCVGSALVLCMHPAGLVGGIQDPTMQGVPRAQAAGRREPTALQPSEACVKCRRQASYAMCVVVRSARVKPISDVRAPAISALLIGTKLVLMHTLAAGRVGQAHAQQPHQLVPVLLLQAASAMQQ